MFRDFPGEFVNIKCMQTSKIDINEFYIITGHMGQSATAHKCKMTLAK